MKTTSNFQKQLDGHILRDEVDVTKKYMWQIAHDQVRFKINKRKDNQGFLVENKSNGNMKLASNFSRDVLYFIKELEILNGVKKHFENAPRRSNLDDWFFKKQELFKVDAIGIYFDKTKNNIQCYDLNEGI